MQRSFFLNCSSRHEIGNRSITFRCISFFEGVCYMNLQVIHIRKLQDECVCILCECVCMSCNFIERAHSKSLYSETPAAWFLFSISCLTNNIKKLAALLSLNCPHISTLHLYCRTLPHAPMLRYFLPPNSRQLWNDERGVMATRPSASKITT